MLSRRISACRTTKPRIPWLEDLILCAIQIGAHNMQWTFLGFISNFIFFSYSFLFSFFCLVFVFINSTSPSLIFLKINNSKEQQPTERICREKMCRKEWNCFVVVFLFVFICYIVCILQLPCWSLCSMFNQQLPLYINLSSICIVVVQRT